MKTKTTLLLLKVLFLATVIVMLIHLILTIVNINPSKVQTYLFALRMPIPSTDSVYLYSICWYIFICALPFYALILFVIIKLIFLFTPLVKGITPFTYKSVKYIRQIGIACLIYAVIGSIINFTVAQIFIASNDLLDWNIEFSLPVIPIILGAIMLSFGEIFSKGLALKQDNDSIV